MCWARVRTWRPGFTCEVHDGVNRALGENLVDLRADREIGVTESRFGGNGGAMTFLEVVQGDDVVAAGKQDFCTNTADITRCTGDQDVQKKTSSKRLDSMRAIHKLAG